MIRLIDILYIFAKIFDYIKHVVFCCRYRMGDDGFWRLQTVRYESIQLTEQRDKDPKVASDSSASDVSRKENDQSASNVALNIEGDRNTNAISDPSDLSTVNKREYTELMTVQDSDDSRGSRSPGRDLRHKKKSSFEKTNSSKLNFSSHNKESHHQHNMRSSHETANLSRLNFAAGSNESHVDDVAMGNRGMGYYRDITESVMEEEEEDGDTMPQTYIECVDSHQKLGPMSLFPSMPQLSHMVDSPGEKSPSPNKRSRQHINEPSVSPPPLTQMVDSDSVSPNKTRRSLRNKDISMPQLTQMVRKKSLSPGKRKRFPKSTVHKVSGPSQSVPVQLVDTGCVINIPNYESSPTKQTGLQTVNMMCNDTSENLAYNLQMLGDVALMVPNTAESAQKDGKEKRSSTKRSATVLEDREENPARKRVRQYVGLEIESGQREARVKRSRKNSSQPSCLSSVVDNSHESDSAETLGSHDSDATSGVLSGDEGTSKVLDVSESRRSSGKRPRKSSPTRRISSPNNRVENTTSENVQSNGKERSNEIVNEELPIITHSKKNGQSKVLPKVKATLVTPVLSDKSKGGNSMSIKPAVKPGSPDRSKGSNSGSIIEKIVRNRSPMKSNANCSDDIFSLFPGPRTRSKEREKK